MSILHVQLCCLFFPACILAVNVVILQLINLLLTLHRTECEDFFQSISQWAGVICVYVPKISSNNLVIICLVLSLLCCGLCWYVCLYILYEPDMLKDLEDTEEIRNHSIETLIEYFSKLSPSLALISVNCTTQPPT